MIREVVLVLVVSCDLLELDEDDDNIETTLALIESRFILACGSVLMNNPTRGRRTSKLSSARGQLQLQFFWRILELLEKTKMVVEPKIEQRGPILVACLCRLL